MRRVRIEIELSNTENFQWLSISFNVIYWYLHNIQPLTYE